MCFGQLSVLLRGCEVMSDRIVIDNSVFNFTFFREDFLKALKSLGNNTFIEAYTRFSGDGGEATNFGLDWIAQAEDKLKILKAYAVYRKSRNIDDNCDDIVELSNLREQNEVFKYENVGAFLDSLIRNENIDNNQIPFDFESLECLYKLKSIEEINCVFKFSEYLIRYAFEFMDGDIGKVGLLNEYNEDNKQYKDVMISHLSNLIVRQITLTAFDKYKLLFNHYTKQSLHNNYLEDLSDYDALDKCSNISYDEFIRVRVYIKKEEPNNLLIGPSMGFQDIKSESKGIVVKKKKFNNSLSDHEISSQKVKDLVKKFHFDGELSKSLIEPLKFTVDELFKLDLSKKELAQLKEYLEFELNEYKQSDVYIDSNKLLGLIREYRDKHV